MHGYVAHTAPGEAQHLCNHSPEPAAASPFKSVAEVPKVQKGSTTTKHRVLNRAMVFLTGKMRMRKVKVIDRVLELSNSSHPQV